MIAVDIGNSFIKTALLRNNEIQSVQQYSSIKEVLSFVTANHVRFIAISSVNPGKTEELIHYCKQNDILYNIIGLQSPFSFSISYATPETLGIDRLCGLEGAISILKTSGKTELFPLITVDSGTATTINCINAKGEFIGGTIMPGIGLMLHSLNLQTAQLPSVSVSNVIPLIGNSTKSCMQSGVLYSSVALIERFVIEIEHNEGKPVNLFFTGGSGEVLATVCTLNSQFIPGLVLTGIISLESI